MHSKKDFDNGAVCDQNSRTNVSKDFSSQKQEFKKIDKN